MERGLPVEQHDVAVAHVPFHDVPYLKIARYRIPVPVVQRLLVAAAHRTDDNSVTVR